MYTSMTKEEVHYRANVENADNIQALWNHIEKEMTGLARFMAFDDSNDLIMDIIEEHAKLQLKIHHQIT